MGTMNGVSRLQSTITSFLSCPLLSWLGVRVVGFGFGDTEQSMRWAKLDVVEGTANEDVKSQKGQML